MTLLTIIVPVYNEESTLHELLSRVQQHRFHDLNIEKEILVVDDASTDRSAAIARAFCDDRPNFHFYSLPAPNGGKGRALKLGYQKGQGDLFLVQDADLEYRCEDYESLIEPIVSGKTPFVLGVRCPVDKRFFWRLRQLSGDQGFATLLNLTGYMLNGLINLLYRAKLADHASMFKVYHRDMLSMIRLENNGFNLELEMVCKFLRKNIHPVQVPVQYQARGRAEGKKIRFFSDGIKFMRTVIKYRLLPDRRL